MLFNPGASVHQTSAQSQPSPSQTQQPQLKNRVLRHGVTQITPFSFLKTKEGQDLKSKIDEALPSLTSSSKSNKPSPTTPNTPDVSNPGQGSMDGLNR